MLLAIYSPTMQPQVVQQNGRGSDGGNESERKQEDVKRRGEGGKMKEEEKRKDDAERKRGDAVRESSLKGIEGGVGATGGRKKYKCTCMVWKWI